MVAGGFEPGSYGKFSVVAAVHLVLECTGCSVEDAVDFVNHHPSPLLCFYKWGSLVPIDTSLSASEYSGTGYCCFMELWLNFYCGGRCRCGGIGQSFLDSNKFSDTDPTSGHGVPALVGVSSSGGGLLSAEEPPWGGFLWSFPFSKFSIVMGMVSGICMVVLSPFMGGHGFGYYLHLIFSGWDQLPSFVTGFCPSSD